ncbi:uncharacterized protein LOC111339863 [Stylophora pistillata]|uniref:uncharacterized protein LOC111339863 n=1 Tax=Stylophora pistillata TaxID=50429 RepID=UPI000C056E0A|nr:uncharacterized protein LOC111339863 [Stylophora pistillata]
MLESYKKLHEKLEIPNAHECQGSVRDRIKSYMEDVKNYLRKTSSVWLLLVDNLTINDPMREFWPSPGQESPWGEGTVLVTTQDSELVPRSHENAEVIPLDSGMEEEDAMELLRVISGMDVDEDAKKVAGVLGYFPLSLACAAVYVGQMREDRPLSKFSWKNYLSNLQKYYAHLDHSDFTHHNPCYPQSMLAAAEFAARRMAENNEILRAAFVFLSYCSLQPVPLDTVADYVLRRTKARVPDDVKLKIARCSLLVYPQTGERGREVVTLHQVMRMAFSQIRRNPDESEGNVDKCEVTGEFLKKKELNGVLQALNEAYKQKKGQLKKEDLALRILLCPHLKEFVEGVEVVQWLEETLLVQALVHFADGLVHVAGATDNYRVTLLERAYKINKQLGCTDIDACTLLCDLGYTYREAGLLDKVIPILDEAIKLCETKTDPIWMKKKSGSLNILAFTFRESGQLDLAKEYMKLSVEVTRKAYGDIHVQLVERLCNLGIILHDRWENDEAIEVLEEAREIVEKCDSAEMFIRGQVLNYTAKVHLRWYLGLRYTHPNECSTKMHLTESVRLHAQALNIYHDLYGDNHKFTTGVMMTYGTAKLHLGDIDEAYEMCQKAFDVYKNSGHIAWPRAGNYLADVLLTRGEYRRAKELLEELVQAHKNLNLVMSPGACRSRALLGEASVHVGDVDAGKTILEECLQEWKEKEIHPEHYFVVRTQALLEGLKSRESRKCDGRSFHESINSA